MKFFDDTFVNSSKKNHIVCGDYYISEHTKDCSYFILCDGIGSGIYANIAAHSTASQLLNLFHTPITYRGACEMTAESMHRARNGNFPFVAFTTVKIYTDGRFRIFNYEAPDPILISDGQASEIRHEDIRIGTEFIRESSGRLELGESLLICSDGVTQAGLGFGYTMGIGTPGLVQYLNARLLQKYNVFENKHEFMRDLIDYTIEISGNDRIDDTTGVLINCRTAKEVTIATGPPADRRRDTEFANKLNSAPGKKVICGSTTTDVIARVLGTPAKSLTEKLRRGVPPEYSMENMDLVAEGAMLLNQVYNIIEDDPADFQENTPAEKLCKMLHENDCITFLVGESINTAHATLLFKQMGIRPRKMMVELIVEKLKEMGKIVRVKYY